MSSYDYRRYPYRKPTECSSARAPVVIVGAGLAGPTLALNLALRGVPSIVLDEDDTVSLGSRSICQAKHTLEVWDRFGLAERMVEKGITWEQGEVYLRDEAIYRFNLTADPHQKFPAFVNLQQYYVEEYLYERCLAEPAIDMRFRHKVVGVSQTRRRRHGRGRDARRPLHDRRRLGRRLRRRAQPGAAHARPAVRGRGLSRSVPDHRRALQG